jgi:hypothetical protein
MTPYVFNNKIKALTFYEVLNLKVDFPLDKKNNLTFAEVEHLIQLYTPLGFLKEYENTGCSSLPFPVDSPMTPNLEIIENTEYYYYQKII